MSDLVTLKPIAVSSFRMLYEFVFETQANKKLNCEQVAAGYNGMIVEIAQLRATVAAQAEQLEAARKNISAIIDRVFESWISSYPIDVFAEPTPGQHGQTIDACSASALRHILPSVQNDVIRTVDDWLAANAPQEQQEEQAA